MIDLIMINILLNEIVDSILSHNAESLSILRKNSSLFLDPVDGVNLHAEVLYCAIKNAEPKIVQYLCDLPVHSSISFFKFCGQTPLSLAVEEGRQDLIPILLKCTDKNFALHMAVNLHQDKVKALLLNQNSANQKLLRYLGI